MKEPRFLPWSKPGYSVEKVYLPGPSTTLIDPAHISGTAVVDSDPRLSDSRDPNVHATSHEDGGTDELLLAPAQVDGTAVITTDPRLLISGGTTSQLLIKDSATDYDVSWVTLPRIYEQDTEPSSPNAGDVWVDSNSTPTPPAYVSYQSTAPVSPSTGDFWVDSDSTPVTLSTAVQTTAVDMSPTATSWLVVCTATLTVTLPTAVGLTGKQLIVKNSGVGTVTVDGDGSELIDGAATQSLSAADSVTVVSTGSGWVIV